MSEFPRIQPATMEWHGKSYQVQPALIESTALGDEDHGILTFWLHLNYGGSGQGAGGFGMDEWREDKDRRVGTAYGCEILIQIIRTVGVGSWEKLKGARVYALRGPGFQGAVKGLYNIDNKGAPLIFDEVAAEMVPEQVAS